MWNNTESSLISHIASTTIQDIDDHHDAASHNHDYNEHFAFDTSLSICGIVIALFICFGNSLTILAIRRNHRLRTIPNMYIGSLAVADLLVGILLLVRGICDLTSKAYLLESEEYLCLSLMSLLFVSVAASMSSSLLVACDRYIYILHSLHYSNLVTKKISLGTICSIWVFAILYGSVPLYANNFTEGEGCSPTHIFPDVYMIIVHPAIFVIISGSTFLFYFEIAKVAIHQNRRIRDLRENLMDSTRQKSVSLRSWRVVKMLFLVFGLFFFSWCPLIFLAFFEYTIHIDHHALAVGCLIAVMNSGINFLVLAAMNRDFGLEFRRILCIKCIRCRSCCRSNKVRPLDVRTVMSSTRRTSVQVLTWTN